MDTKKVSDLAPALERDLALELLDEYTIEDRTAEAWDLQEGDTVRIIRESPCLNLVEKQTEIDWRAPDLLVIRIENPPPPTIEDLRAIAGELREDFHRAGVRDPRVEGAFEVIEGFTLNKIY